METHFQPLQRADTPESRAIVTATPAQRDLLRALFELYAHDFSPITGAEVDTNGRFTPADFLAEPWTPDFQPLLLRVDGFWVGFAWVATGSYIQPGAANHHLMEEFFILRKYRGRGLGRWFAQAIFRRFPGIWEVGEMPDNHAAIAFWRRVIGEFTHGQYTETWVNNTRWEGPVQRFESPILSIKNTA